MDPKCLVLIIAGSYVFMNYLSSSSVGQDLEFFLGQTAAMRVLRNSLVEIFLSPWLVVSVVEKCWWSLTRPANGFSDTSIQTIAVSQICV